MSAKMSLTDLTSSEATVEPGFSMVVYQDKGLEFPLFASPQDLPQSSRFLSRPSLILLISYR